MSVERGTSVIAESDRAKFLQELNDARSMVNGVGAPVDLLNADNFPLLAKYSPFSLELLQGTARNNVESDTKKIELANKHSGIWYWADDRERAFLIDAVALGLGKEALAALRKDYEKRIKDMNNNRAISFGV